MFQVGDVVVVERASGVNAAGARGVVVEAYELREAGVKRPGWMLLFQDGRADGFSPRDCGCFGVRKVGHDARIAGYVFKSMTWLDRDWRQGRFSSVWSDGQAVARDMREWEANEWDLPPDERFTR